MVKINLRNSVTECAQSIKKENAGKFYNYGIQDCIKSIAAQKQECVSIRFLRSSLSNKKATLGWLFVNYCISLWDYAAFLA
jgi:hypothetical protein